MIPQNQKQCILTLCIFLHCVLYVRDRREIRLLITGQCFSHVFFRFVAISPHHTCKLLIHAEIGEIEIIAHIVAHLIFACQENRRSLRCPRDVDERANLAVFFFPPPPDFRMQCTDTPLVCGTRSRIVQKEKWLLFSVCVLLLFVISLQQRHFHGIFSKGSNFCIKMREVCPHIVCVVALRTQLIFSFIITLFKPVFACDLKWRLQFT